MGSRDSMGSGSRWAHRCWHRKGGWWMRFRKAFVCFGVLCKFTKIETICLGESRTKESETSFENKC